MSISKMATSLSIVGVIWSVLSLSATLITCVGYFMPYWLSGETLPSNGGMLLRQTSFGTFRRCGYSYTTVKTNTAAASADAGVERHFASGCGRYKSFEDIPSVWWQATTVVVGCGCCLAVVVVAAALLCCCVSDAMSRRLGITACIVQLTAGPCTLDSAVFFKIQCLYLSLSCGGFMPYRTVI